jgi:hypothetical protein
MLTIKPGTDIVATSDRPDAGARGQRIRLEQVVGPLRRRVRPEYARARGTAGGAALTDNPQIAVLPQDAWADRLPQ